jgi:hypothetical protein
MSSQLNLNNAVASTLNSSTTISQKSMDSPQDLKETIWRNDKAGEYWGLFDSQPDLQTALLLKSYWTVGGGYTCDIPTETVLNNVSGWGKDTFFDVLFNLDVTANIFGDSYAHIIFNGEKAPQNIINIKPLNSASMAHVVGSDGIIIRYEQTQPDGSIKKFDPEDILHFSTNRLGDQIHGISRIAALKDTVEAYNEIDKDIRKVAHQTAVPLIIWKLKTDDPTTINNFVTRIQNARKLTTGSDVFIPDDEKVVSFEILNVTPNELLMAWKNAKRDDFYRAVQLPQIMPGASGGGTESEGKTIYLAHEMITKKDRLTREKQIKSQLGLSITIYPAPSMQPAMQSDTSKDGALVANQPSDTQAGVGR